MRHMDVFLKHPNVAIPRDVESVEEAKKLYEAIAARAKAVQHMSQTEGWKLFVAALKHEETTIMGHLEVAKTGEEHAKLVGSLLAVKSFQTWAEDEFDQAQDQLRDANL